MGWGHLCVMRLSESEEVRDMGEGERWVSGHVE